MLGYAMVLSPVASPDVGSAKAIFAFQLLATFGWMFASMCDVMAMLL
jgi:hypothetical protein